MFFNSYTQVIFCSLTYLVLVHLPNAVADVYSCGGFVKLPHNIEIDYSKIQVKLLTAEGNLKYETECNPSNGYYLIPVYSKGVYLMRVFAPDGWYFEPESFEIKVDGTTDVCTLNEDINFVLSSFAVDGVLKSGNGGGPAGVSLTLSKEDGQVIATTTTVVNGIYKFRAPPGKYMVSTANGSAECIERGKVPVEVRTKPIHVSPDLKISGHLLTVVVQSGIKPVQNVVISLFTENSIKLPDCIGDPKVVRGIKKLACSVRTDESGKARFQCLPPGRYDIVPSFSTSKAQFAFAPKVFNLEMGSSQQEVNFDVLGFNARGRVVIGDLPVENANVLVNGKRKGVTDKNGWFAFLNDLEWFFRFVLKELQEMSYVITAEKPHYYFDVINVNLSSENADIPLISTLKVDICGSLEVEEEKNLVATIFITNKFTGDPQSVRTDINGKFCKGIAPSTYIVSPSNENGIVMMPKQREVVLSDGPILDVVFTQFKANILVKVFCIAACDKLEVQLWNDKELVKSLIGTDEFRFSSVVPDFYKVKIVDGNRFCWEKSEISFTVERSHIDDLSFRQTGYRATLNLSHPAKLKWEFAENKQVTGELKVTAGTTTLCLPMAGKYNIKFDACYLFENSVYLLFTPQSSELNVSADKFLLTLLITPTEKLLTNHSDFIVNVKGLNEVATLKPSESFPEKFSFRTYLPISDSGKKITLQPQSAVYLFEPLSHEFVFTGECHENEISFKAVKGSFIEGALQSAVENVKIQAKHRKIKEYILETLTSKDGTYRLGPVRNLADFEILAEKEGYKFETNSNGTLVPVKLSHLHIVTVDALSGEALGDVLLSLSGVQNYRSNNIIDKTGVINFVGLHPGEYFIRPILQEYRFEPPSLSINVEDGKDETVVLKGKQFAYSVFGKVSHMAGQPVEGLIVEAVSEQCSQLQEEDTTLEDGSFRIRGLRPQCIYKLTLKSLDGKVLHSYPTFYEISVVDKHVNGVNFVLIHFEKTVDVIGNIEFIGLNSPQHYRVALYKRDVLIQRCSVSAPSRVFFFDNIPFDGAEYSARFETDHNYNGEKYMSSEVTFLADSTYKTIKLQAVSQQKLAEVEITLGTYLALPFFIFIAILFFNHEKAISLVEETFSRFSAYSARNHSPSPADDSNDSYRKRMRYRRL
uniref:Nodal modulator 1 n=1 Tax=Syphacia muris TaxID=451379 RepID=A0A0N5AZ94_9BILA